ncbi:hypothetical protein U9R90_20100 [Streptomyces sp. E11-3]|uniref:hypothetical protein n=1 Tax=Streptomyces sp. E11-3 TaxID=3110112 RepID=UPI00397FF84E
MRTTLTAEFWTLFVTLLVIAMAAVYLATIGAEACYGRGRRQRPGHADPRGGDREHGPSTGGPSGGRPVAAPRDTEPVRGPVHAGRE